MLAFSRFMAGVASSKKWHNLKLQRAVRWLAVESGGESVLVRRKRKKRETPWVYIPPPIHEVPALIPTPSDDYDLVSRAERAANSGEVEVWRARCSELIAKCLKQKGEIRWLQSLNSKQTNRKPSH